MPLIVSFRLALLLSLAFICLTNSTRSSRADAQDQPTATATATAAAAAAAPPFYRDKLNLMHFLDERGAPQPVKSLADWQIRRTHILRNFELVTGPLAGPERKVELDVRVEQVEELETYVRKKITFATDANDRVPAYLLIPKQIKGRVPAVLCLHQTTDIASREPDGLGESADLHYAAARRGARPVHCGADGSRSSGDRKTEVGTP